MQYPTQRELRELSSSDRLKLIEDVWSTFVDQPETLPLSDEHRREIDRRIDARNLDSDSGSSWPDVRERIARR